MTEEEVLALKPGDRVRTHINGRENAEAVVVQLRLRFRSGTRLWCAGVRRVGLTDFFITYPVVWRRPDELFPDPVSLFDRVEANVIADWLEEQGETRAAQLLRERFPLKGGRQ